MGGIYNLGLVMNNGRQIKNCFRNNKIPVSANVLEFKGTCASGLQYDLGKIKALQVDVSYDAGTTLQSSRMEIIPPLTEYVFDL